METEPRADTGFQQLASRLGVATWQLRLAREHGLIPEPDGNGRWSADLARQCEGRVAQIVAAFGDMPPVGAGKAAARLALRLRLDVEKADIEVLVARGELTPVGRFQRNPIYLLRDLDALEPGNVAEVVAARKGPLLDRVDVKGAALVLGWSKGIFARVADERALPADQLRRYALADVRALAEDGDLTSRIRAEQRDQALTRARRTEERHEDALRSWMMRCTAYLDRTTEDPPDASIATRALKGVTAARSSTAAHTG
jgi:hypothetical protein